MRLQVIEAEALVLNNVEDRATGNVAALCFESFLAYRSSESATCRILHATGCLDSFNLGQLPSVL